MILEYSKQSLIKKKSYIKESEGKEKNDPE